MKITMPDGQIVENKTPQFKTPWNHDTNFESERTATFCKEPSLTKQEFKEDTDINVILERFMKTGEPPPMTLPEHFTDLTGRKTYYEIQTQLAEANAKFYTLPAETRAEHQNDPTKWADEVVRAVEKQDADKLQALGIDVSVERAAAAEHAAKAQRARVEAMKASEAAKAASKSDTGK